MNKLLITGYKHSGTTMLMQLLRSHPQVGWIEFEEGYIEYDKPKEWVIMMAKKRVSNLKEKVWGEKLPWGDRDSDKNSERSIGFTKKWLKYFRNDARVIHIIRHPIDAASSGRPDGHPGDDALKQILKTVPLYIDFSNNDKRIASVCYEDLLIEPRIHLDKIFNFLGIVSSQKVLDVVTNTKLKFGKINADRAYAFEKKGIESNINYDEILKKINVRL